MKCELCGRENICTKHHLIPRTNHKNKWFKKNFTKDEMIKTIYLCKYECHPYIHSIISEKELGRKYNTLDKLKRHFLVNKFVIYIKSKCKQDCHDYLQNNEPN